MPPRGSPSSKRRSVVLTKLIIHISHGKRVMKRGDNMTPDTDKLERNPYFTYARDSFVKSYERKKELEKAIKLNFNRELVDEYDAIEAKIAKDAIEMLKLGVSFREDGGALVFVFGGELYSVPYADMAKAVGAEQMDILVNHKRRDGAEAGAGKETAEAGAEPSPEPEPEPQRFQATADDVVYGNPLAQALSMMIAAPGIADSVKRQQAQAAKDEAKRQEDTEQRTNTASDILRDISSVQKRVILFEQEKNGIEESLGEAKRQVDGLQAELEETKRRMEEDEARAKKRLDDAATEREKLLEKSAETERGLDKYKEKSAGLEKNVMDLTATVRDKEQAISQLKDENYSLKQQLSDAKVEYSHSHDNDIKTITALEVNAQRAADEKAALEAKANGFSEDADRARREADSLRKDLSKAREDAADRIRDAEDRAKAADERARTSTREADDLRQKLKDANGKAKAAEERAEKGEAALKEADAHAKEADEKAKAAERRRQELDDRVKGAEARTREAEARAKGAEEKLKGAEERARAAESNLKKKEETLKEKDGKIQSLSSELAKKPKIDEAEIKKITEERDSFKEKAGLLEREAEGLRETLEGLNDEIAKLSSVSAADVDELKRLAYEDGKFPMVLNSNAFNRDIEELGTDGVILSRVGIRGMKRINEVDGPAAGDNVIEAVANALVRAFPESGVYRVLGDQFNVVVDNETLNTVEGQLADVSRELYGQQINIAYGTAVGNNCADIGEMIETAGERMHKQKSAPLNGDAVRDYDKATARAQKPERPAEKKTEGLEQVL